MPTIKARYLSGDTHLLDNCSTVNDIQVQVATRHHVFAPAVTVLDASCVVLEDTFMEAPDEVHIVVNETVSRDGGADWHTLIISHARARDLPGVHRALRACVDAGFSATQTALCPAFFCSEVLFRYLERCAPPQAASARDALSVECVRCLLDARADLTLLHEARDNYRWFSLFSMACYSGQAEVVRVLLEALADPQEEDNVEGVLWAARRGHTDVLQILLVEPYHVDVNYADDWGVSALMYASKNRHVGTVRMLLAALANVNAADYYGENALLEAASAGSADVVDILVNNKAHIHYATVDDRGTVVKTSLSAACVSDCADVVALLLEHGVNTNQQADGRAPLHIACSMGKARIVSMLVGDGAGTDINLLDKEDCTPLVTACLNACAADGVTDTWVDIVHMLVEHKADVHCDDDNIALHAACEGGSVAVVRALLETCVPPLDVHCVDTEGHTALACTGLDGDHADVVQLLLDHGLDVQKDGGDVLARARVRGYNGMVRVLSAAGVGASDLQKLTGEGSDDR